MRRGLRLLTAAASWMSWTFGMPARVAPSSRCAGPSALPKPSALSFCVAFQCGLSAALAKVLRFSVQIRQFSRVCANLATSCIVANIAKPLLGFNLCPFVAFLAIVGTSRRCRVSLSVFVGFPSTFRELPCKWLLPVQVGALAGRYWGLTYVLPLCRKRKAVRWCLG